MIAQKGKRLAVSLNSHNSHAAQSSTCQNQTWNPSPVFFTIRYKCITAFLIAR
jgi:hypothetical protein